MNRHSAKHAVVGWIDIRSESPAGSSWFVAGADDLTRNLERLTGKAALARPMSSERLVTRAPAQSTDGSRSRAEHSPARRHAQGEQDRVPADLAELSRELDARLAEIHSRLVNA